eukprot:531405-Amphidinium_carterae.1
MSSGRMDRLRRRDQLKKSSHGLRHHTSLGMIQGGELHESAALSALQQCKVDAFMRSVEGSRAGMLSYALRRVPPKDQSLECLRVKPYCSRQPFAAKVCY